VDAVFAVNDAHAIGFMSGLQKAGLLREGPASSQPVEVIRLGDLEMGRSISPSLSTIIVHGDGTDRRHADVRAQRAAPHRSWLRTGATQQRLDIS
jgi:LacI family transcriptional regulator, gluconate utilization system Gnt-I transcriptional repressor